MTKFAFMIHPRNIVDYGRIVGKRLGIGEELGMKILPKGPAEWLLKHLKVRAGFNICSNFDVWGKSEGYIIGVMLTGSQMNSLPRPFVKKRIIDAILFAQNKLGVERIGLGGYIAPITRNGLDVIKDPNITCAITHGDALSSVSSIEAIKQCAKIKQINISNSIIAIVGAYGIVGRAASLLLPKLGPKELILAGPNLNKLKAVEKVISDNYSGNILCSSDNQVIANADIVLLCTTASGTIVDNEILKKHAVVIDMAQPANMGIEVCNARPDVLRIDGGYMTIPHINLGFAMGPPKGATFACLTETMISTLINDTENHVGPVDLAFAGYIWKQAQELGFELAPFTNFSKPLSE